MNKDARSPVDDYVKGLERLHPLADYVTVNVSSPNTPGLRALQAAERLVPLLEALLQARARLAAGGRRRKPLFVKVAPDLADEEIDGLAEVALAAGVDGLIVGNTTVSRPPDLRSAHKGEAGGLSGRPLFALSTRVLARFATRLRGRLPLVAAGGVSDADTAYAKIRAGATAVQLYTALVYEGPGLVARLLRGLDR
jgi:dihydroorotate dehydrogenase